MGKASAVMYSIANIFNWIILIASLVCVVFSILSGANIVHVDGLGWGTLVYFIIVFLVALVTIWMVRRAKGKGTSKGWDILFIVIGVLEANIFYILGGIFGLCERR